MNLPFGEAPRIELKAPPDVLGLTCAIGHGDLQPLEEFGLEPQEDSFQDTHGCRTTVGARQRTNTVRETMAKLDLRGVFLRVMGLVGLSPSPDMESRTTGHVSMQCHELSEEWELVNGRRLSLIEREHHGRLSIQEQRELEGLQETATRHVAARFPLPWAQLEALEQAVDRLPSNAQGHDE